MNVIDDLQRLRQIVGKYLVFLLVEDRMRMHQAKEREHVTKRAQLHYDHHVVFLFESLDQLHYAWMVHLLQCLYFQEHLMGLMQLTDSVHVNKLEGIGRLSPHLDCLVHFAVRSLAEFGLDAVAGVCQ